MSIPVVPFSERARFSFPSSYLEQWRTFEVPMPATGLVTMLRTYSTIKEDGHPESWFDICKRVVEGAFSLYRYHCQKHGTKPDHDFETKWSRRMFESMMRLEWCPAGRGLQHMGHDRMWVKGGAVLNSCAFVSTFGDRDAEWVYFLADMSMMGVGVGFDTRGAGAIIKAPVLEGVRFRVEDTREGWAGILHKVVKAHMEGSDFPAVVDFSGLRPKGAPLVTMGGISSGPGPLIDAVQRLFRVLDPSRKMTLSPDGLLIYMGKSETVESTLTAEQILDIGNTVGVCVVSGGIRRSAEICLFDSRPESEETAFSAKQDQAKLMEYRWASNNSITVMEHRDVSFFKKVVESCSTFGDPGLLFLKNIHGWGRVGEPNSREMLASGTNPCGEQILESYELCNLVETVPGRGHHPTAAQCSFLYGKLVSLLPIHYPRTRRIVERNRRVGVSLTGWVEHAFPEPFPRTQEWLEDFLNESYSAIQALDRVVSGKVLVGVPTSIKTTSVKPSGSVSLVLGTSPGMNAHFAPHYIRRINIENSSPLLTTLRDAGYTAVPNIYSPTSHVVEFPCKTESRTTFSAVEQLETLRLLQHHWSDNMVSNTIVFDDSEVDDVARWVYDNQDWLRSLSFLRRQHSFAQAPLEEITPEEYDVRVSQARPLSSTESLTGSTHDVSSEDKWCDGGRCVIGEVPEVSESESEPSEDDLSPE